MHVVSVQVGQPKTYNWNGKEVFTAIFKDAVEGRIPSVGNNLEGDLQGNQLTHGGTYQAVYAYPYEHYPLWESALQTKLPFGALGENLTTEGLLEEQIHPGDRFRVGTLELIACGPRLPCVKLALRLQDDSIVEKFNDADKPGIYFAIAKQGDVAKGDPIELLERASTSLTIVDLMRLRLGRDNDSQRLKEAATLTMIPDRWRTLFLERAG